MKHVLILFLSILFITSCTEEPVADFSTDKEEYLAGETVVLTNSSTNGAKYKWTFPDGETAVSEHAEFILKKDLEEQDMAIQLQVFSKNGKKSDYATKVFTVKPLMGKVNVWLTSKRPFNNSYVSVYIDNDHTGYISDSLSTAPPCGSYQSLTSAVTAGEHEIYVSGYGSRRVYVEYNSCTQVAF